MALLTSQLPGPAAALIFCKHRTSHRHSKQTGPREGHDLYLYAADYMIKTVTN